MNNWLTEDIICKVSELTAMDENNGLSVGTRI